MADEKKDLNLGLELKKKLDFVNQEMSRFGEEEIFKCFGKIEGLKISQPLFPVTSYIQFKKYGCGDSLTEKDNVELLDKGIWPKYYLEGIFYNPKITHFDYLSTSLIIFVSTNYCLSDYYATSTRNLADCAKEGIIDLSSIFFLRDQGITNEIWNKLVKRDKSLRNFCLRRNDDFEKIKELAQDFKEKEVGKLEYKSFIVSQNHFNDWEG
ncbi:hypothetical protein J4474_02615 [Candidatus Pacearchaeota archaeon]|nr:hypothetical protein [Candidatus Pacearchaeota archaeon]